MGTGNPVIKHDTVRGPENKRGSEAVECADPCFYAK